MFAFGKLGRRSAISSASEPAIQVDTNPFIHEEISEIDTNILQRHGDRF
jgi:hypothetical protein